MYVLGARKRKKNKTWVTPYLAQYKIYISISTFNRHIDAFELKCENPMICKD